jgi:hypothetical protein
MCSRFIKVTALFLLCGSAQAEIKLREFFSSLPQNCIQSYNSFLDAKKDHQHCIQTTGGKETTKNFVCKDKIVQKNKAYDLVSSCIQSS